MPAQASIKRRRVAAADSAADEESMARFEAELAALQAATKARRRNKGRRSRTASTMSAAPVRRLSTVLAPDSSAEKGGLTGDDVRPQSALEPH